MLIKELKYYQEIKLIPEALKAMDLLKEKADIVVVSNTPTKIYLRMEI